MPVVTQLKDYAAHRYSIEVRCSCGHTRVIPGDWLLKKLGPEYSPEIQEADFKRRLRCSACGKREPNFSIGRY